MKNYILSAVHQRRIKSNHSSFSSPGATVPRCNKAEGADAVAHAENLGCLFSFGHTSLGDQFFQSINILGSSSVILS
jgi:hypothetical protein